ncbi:hypothetical protein [Desulfovibrio sp.]|nr:hypothetical protein [Desulfovibrio sp.]
MGHVVYFDARWESTFHSVCCSLGQEVWRNDGERVTPRNGFGVMPV